VEFFGRDAPLEAQRDVSITLRRGQHLRTLVKAPDELEGPIPPGVQVGSVTVLVDGSPVRIVPLVTAERVPAAGPLRKVVNRLAGPGGIALAVTAAILAALAFRRIRPGASAKK
jgi:hypothetical protein